MRYYQKMFRSKNKSQTETRLQKSENTLKPSSVSAVSIMNRIKEGDRKAFEEFYNIWKGPIMSYLVHMLKNRSLAEELTQEVFIRVYKNVDSYEPRASVQAWLFTLARNLAIDHFRKHSREIELAPETLDGLADESPLNSAEAKLLENVKQAQLEDCLSKLPQSQKEAITLRTVSELSYEEISTLMKVSTSSVKTWIHRGKTSLLDCLRHQERQ
jgi:RNA polymerase sigma-70 factor (ECF subfamily)